MRFENWEPIYQCILDDFGFSREHDEEAARLLSCLLRDRRPDEILGEAIDLVKGQDVIVCGNAPSLVEEMKTRLKQDSVLIAADGATAVLFKEARLPSIIVTDLDGPFPAIKESNQKGSIVVVHAHGDNLEALKSCVPQLVRVIGSTQSCPLHNVYNFGGFTDGDRCVFLARHLGAAAIEFIGFDFDDPTVTPRKKKKLAWCRRLIDLAMSELS
jgi:uncharacterized Rossmann fold enzyme